MKVLQDVQDNESDDAPSTSGRFEEMESYTVAEAIDAIGRSRKYNPFHVASRTSSAAFCTSAIRDCSTTSSLPLQALENFKSSCYFMREALGFQMPWR